MSRKGKKNADRHKRIRAAAARARGKRGDTPHEFRAAAGIAAHFKAADPADKKTLASFTMMAYSGAPMTPEGFNHPIIVDLAGVKISNQHRPILRQHDHSKIVGHSTEIKVDEDGIHVKGVVSNPSSPHAQEIVELSGNKFQWQASIGANPDPSKMEFLESGEEADVNGRTVYGPLNISRSTDLGEVSFVPLGADGATSASVQSSARRGKPMYKAMLRASAKFSDDEVNAMDEDTAKAALKKCMSAADDDSGGDDDDEKKKKKKDDEDDKDKKSESKRMNDFKSSLAKMREEFRADMAKESAVELKRQEAIRSATQRYGITEIEVEGKKVNLAAHAIENQWTTDKTELHALRAARPGAGVGVVPGGHLHFGSDPVMNGAVLECAVFDALRGSFKLFDDDFYEIGEGGRRRVSNAEQKRIQVELNAAYPDQIRQAAHTHFKSQIGLKQLLAICAQGAGYRGSENWGSGDWGTIANHLAASAQSIRADASTVNTPATLANVQNKFMLQGYMFTEQTFMEIASILPVKDLKPTKSVQMFGDFQFQGLNPAGEIQHGTIGDNPYANQAKLKARMITLELQYIINDDLGMFGQVPMMLGRGWGLAMNDRFWTVFMNPGYDESGVTAFYAATHTVTGQVGNSNLSSGASTTLTSEGLRLANILFANQIDPAGKPLGIDPELLIYPPELDNVALELMNAQFIVMAGLASTSSASKQPNTNIWKGRYKPLMSRYLNKAAYTGYSTAYWYLLANPGIIPVVQIACLNGQMTPTIQTAGQDWQFNQLGMSMRGWGGFDAAAQNYRGAVRSNGA